MKSPIVVATVTTVLFMEGRGVHVLKGQAWAAGSIVVKRHPELFSDSPRDALGLDLAPAEPVVESKTAAPGEKSNARRRG